MTKEVFYLQEIGEDDWGRKVFNVKDKEFVLKQYDYDDGFYVAAGFYAEPAYRLDSKKYETILV